MSITDEINSAISAHGQWKQKLRKIIDPGESEYTITHVESDKNCSFGKWLYERISPEHKNSPQYARAVELHAQFHKEAAKVMSLGMRGEKEAANKAMGLTAAFSQTSAALTKELNNWKGSL